MNSPASNSLLKNFDQAHLVSSPCSVAADDKNEEIKSNKDKELLDRHFPLKAGSHKDAVSYSMYCAHLMIRFRNGTVTGLLYPEDVAEIFGEESEPQAIVLKNTYLQAEIDFDNQGFTRSVSLKQAA